MIKSLEIIEQQYPEFCAAIEKRLHVGAVDYGDKSFDLDSPTVMEEIEQEILDINGWSFILWVRSRRVKEALRQLESRTSV